MIFQNSLLARGTNDINKILSSFYNKLNKIVTKHAPFKTVFKRRKKKLSKTDNKRNSDFDQNKKNTGFT